MFKIRIYSRGGQGGKTAAEIFAAAVINKGKEAKTFPEFGPERTGAPTNFYIKVSDREIRSNEPVVNPDVIVVLDEDLPNISELPKTLKKNGVLIFNSNSSAKDIREKFFLKFPKVKIFVIDATGISLSLFSKDFPNIPVMGALAKVAGIVSVEELSKGIKEKFSNLSAEMQQKNIDALKQGYEKNN